MADPLPQGTVALRATEHAAPSLEIQERLARLAHDRDIAMATLSSTDMDKDRMHRLAVQRLQDEDGQRVRDDEHRTLLTWIGFWLVVLTSAAIGVSYWLKPELGDKLITPAFTFIGTIVGGLGFNRAAAGAAHKALPSKGEST